MSDFSHGSCHNPPCTKFQVVSRWGLANARPYYKQNFINEKTLHKDDGSYNKSKKKSSDVGKNRNFFRKLFSKKNRNSSFVDCFVDSFVGHAILYFAILA